MVEQDAPLLHARARPAVVAPERDLRVVAGHLFLPGSHGRARHEGRAERTRGRAAAAAPDARRAPSVVGRRRPRRRRSRPRAAGDRARGRARSSRRPRSRPTRRSAPGTARSGRSAGADGGVARSGPRKQWRRQPSCCCTASTPSMKRQSAASTDSGRTGAGERDAARLERRGEASTAAAIASLRGPPGAPPHTRRPTPSPSTIESSTTSGRAARSARIAPRIERCAPRRRSPMRRPRSDTVPRRRGPSSVRERDAVEALAEHEIARRGRSPRARGSSRRGRG